MKPQVIRFDRNNHQHEMQIDRWLKANGCPWLVLIDTPIQVTGNYIIVETLTIKNQRQADTLWPRRTPRNWTLPTKVRKYRIRHELRWDK